MKIRAGFISNSSSSSFIINYPKEYLKLKDIEDYFGGYNDDVPEDLRDIVSYVLWKSQPTNPQGETPPLYDCRFKTRDERLNHRLEASYDSFECNNCRLYYDDEDCKECPCKKLLSEKEQVQRLIDDNYWGNEWLKILKSFKKNCGKVRVLNIENNYSDNTISGLDWADAYRIGEYAGKLFKKHDKILESFD